MIKRKSGLIVDDEPGFRDLFRFHLEQQGIRVVSARDGIEALEKLETRRFDIVFSDIHMPRMDGTALLNKLLLRDPTQLVIMLSSTSDPECLSEKRAIETGAVTWLAKPFSMCELDELLSLLERKRGYPDRG